MHERILILGGTAEAREIADALVDQGHDVTTSLAGVTSHPILPKGKIRSGGFGGADGLRAYLKEHKITHLIDATHPYAAIISHNAHEAMQDSVTKLMRFERAAWKPRAGDTWIAVSSLSQAVQILPARACVLLTTGRKELDGFLRRPDLAGVIRTVEPPSQTLPAHWHLLLDRPPHTLSSEIALMQQWSITHLVTKNAGSQATRAKLDAARNLHIPVIMVERPQKPICATFHSIESLLAQF
jgi:precorrin-6A/cobalt-precorrin-6A reductase